MASLHTQSTARRCPSPIRRALLGHDTTDSIRRQAADFIKSHGTCADLADLEAQLEASTAENGAAVPGDARPLVHEVVRALRLRLGIAQLVDRHSQHSPLRDRLVTLLRQDAEPSERAQAAADVVRLGRAAELELLYEMLQGTWVRFGSRVDPAWAVLYQTTHGLAARLSREDGSADQEALREREVERQLLEAHAQGAFRGALRVAADALAQRVWRPVEAYLARLAVDVFPPELLEETVPAEVLTAATSPGPDHAARRLLAQVARIARLLQPLTRCHACEQHTDAGIAFAACPRCRADRPRNPLPRYVRAVWLLGGTEARRRTIDGWLDALGPAFCADVLWTLGLTGEGRTAIQLHREGYIERRGLGRHCPPLPELACFGEDPRLAMLERHCHDRVLASCRGLLPRTAPGSPVLDEEAWCRALLAEDVASLTAPESPSWRVAEATLRLSLRGTRAEVDALERAPGNDPPGRPLPSRVVAQRIDYRLAVERAIASAAPSAEDAAALQALVAVPASTDLGDTATERVEHARRSAAHRLALGGDARAREALYALFAGPLRRLDLIDWRVRAAAQDVVVRLTQRLEGPPPHARVRDRNGRLWEGGEDDLEPLLRQAERAADYATAERVVAALLEAQHDDLAWSWFRRLSLRLVAPPHEHAPYSTLGMRAEAERRTPGELELGRHLVAVALELADWGRCDACLRNDLQSWATSACPSCRGRRGRNPFVPYLRTVAHCWPHALTSLASLWRSERLAPATPAWRRRLNRRALADGVSCPPLLAAPWVVPPSGDIVRRTRVGVSEHRVYASPQATGGYGIRARAAWIDALTGVESSCPTPDLWRELVRLGATRWLVEYADASWDLLPSDAFSCESAEVASSRLWHTDERIALSRQLMNASPWLL